MDQMRKLGAVFLACLVALAAAPGSAHAQRPQQQAGVGVNGRRDFDFEIGEWTTRLSRLQRPLMGSKTWVRYEGTTVVRALLGGRANVAELSVKGPAGQIVGLALRLYEPESGEWTLNYANISDGVLTPPVRGRFRNGRGEFFAKDTLNGRPILVRFVISDVTPRSARFEQAFSDDGGSTWEINWVATDTRR